MAKQLKEFTFEEVSKHNKEGDLWIIIDSQVYDVSKFANLHPGGASVLLNEKVAGQDATKAFFGLHRQEVLLRSQYSRLIIGSIVSQKSIIKALVPGELSQVPYAEPSWLRTKDGWQSPFYTDNHRKFQQAVRKFMMEVVEEEAKACEQEGRKVSQEVLDKMAEVNMHAMRLGPGKHLQGRVLMNGIVKPEEFDYFHELIISSEFGRLGQRSFMDGILAGMVIGLPPVLHFSNSPSLQARVVDEVLSGKKWICLAISEAFAGSDVAGMQTVAKKVPKIGGKPGELEWEITGTKKWITNGRYSDWFTTACKTDKGYTMILIPRTEGVSTKPIKTTYSQTAGTAYVTFEKVRVPLENTLGKEGAGMLVILSNFNHERWMICCISIRTQRLIVEECLKWSNQREVFGQPLIAQPVIRSKLANMIARVEACQSWLEDLTHQMNNMSYNKQSDQLAGPIGLLKQFATKCGRDTGEDAVQIFGGRAITTTGMGQIIENYRRTVVFDAVLGGAEDILGDLGVRQAAKKMPKTAKL